MGSASHCVLVVEDNQDVRETLLEILEHHGYRAVGAVHGREALEKLDGLSAHCCMIVLDLSMPVMDGRAFRRAQLAHPSAADIPVIVISARSVVQKELEELRPAAYLRKPLDLRMLLDLVQQHCAPGSA